MAQTVWARIKLSALFTPRRKERRLRALNPWEVPMHAHVGDRVHVLGRVVGQAEHAGQVRAIREQPTGEPLYWVHYDNGSDSLLCPGPDLKIEHRPDCPPR
jgi:hypothetical protein